jgi:hypothetical protein
MKVVQHLETECRLRSCKCCGEKRRSEKLSGFIELFSRGAAVAIVNPDWMNTSHIKDSEILMSRAGIRTRTSAVT